MNPQVLREMAAGGGGVHVDAGLKSIELDRIYKDIIARMDKEQREYEAKKIERGQPWHWLFALTALILLIIEALIPERTSRSTAATAETTRRVA
jgi:hypothetical protein